MRSRRMTDTMAKSSLSDETLRDLQNEVKMAEKLNEQELEPFITEAILRYTGRWIPSIASNWTIVIDELYPIDEMIMFPKCEHDDMMDAHAQMLRIATFKAHQPKELEKETAFNWLRKQNSRAHNKRIRQKMFGINGRPKLNRGLPARESYW